MGGFVVESAGAMTTNEVLAAAQWHAVVMSRLSREAQWLRLKPKAVAKGAEWAIKVQSRSAVAQTETESRGSKAQSRRSRFSREAQWLGPKPKVVVQRRTVGELPERELTPEKV